MLFRTLSASVVALAVIPLIGCAPTAESAPRTVSLSLNETAAAAALGEQLPLELEFFDDMGTAQVASLPVPLDAVGAYSLEYTTGDVAYWAEGQKLVVFLAEVREMPAHGIVVVGHVEEGLDGIASCAHECAFVVEKSER